MGSFVSEYHNASQFTSLVGGRKMNIMMLLMIALYAVANAQPEEKCSSDMQKRGSICCKTKICGLNEDYRLCNDTYREDTCVPCPPDTFNDQYINTSLEYYHRQHQNVCKNASEICVDTKCLEEAKIKLHECLRTGKVTCECDISRGFCGEDPRTCRSWQGNVTELKKGIELTLNCQLKKCNDGNFKDKEGYGKCHKHRECSNGEMIISNGNRTMNTQCGTRSNAGHVWIVIVVILGILVIIEIVIIIYICWCREQRGRDNHCNGFSANSGDLGQNEQEMSDMRETMIPNGGHAA